MSLNTIAQRFRRATVSRALTLERQRRSFHVRRAPEPPSAHISQLLASYAAHPPHPLSLNSLVAFGQPLTPESVLRSVSYVLSEIPRRLARRARALETLPFIVGTNPYVSKTLNAYRQSFQFLASYPPVTTLEENTAFTAELSHLVESHRNDIPTMAKGFQECAKYMSPTQISNFLDGAIRNRISVRLIAEQHIALSQALESQRDVGITSHHGIVDMACSPVTMVKMCGAFVSELCEATLGATPTIVIDGHPDATFAYVPVHLEYILTEIFKNAFRATVEHHYKLHGTTSAHPMAPVTVTISPPPSLTTPFLSIRVRDQGGGVSPSNMARIFSYAFTTAGHADSDGSGPYAAQHVGGSAAVVGGTSGGEGNLFGEITGKGVQVGLGTIAGLGYGLPMSRLYATYFGGSLDLFSLDRWGKYPASLDTSGFGRINECHAGSDVYAKLRSVDQAGNAQI
ncbi:branched-chain alpha-ketoacid dehydrogenase [Chiua virens]|nr:branched-chain alpha-ketoacid dehydrogenase [Chiua virens]